MSDAETPSAEGEKSIEDLKKELEEISDEIDVARREVDAEHPQHPHFIDGAEGE